MKTVPQLVPRWRPVVCLSRQQQVSSPRAPRCRLSPYNRSSNRRSRSLWEIPVFLGDFDPSSSEISVLLGDLGLFGGNSGPPRKSRYVFLGIPVYWGIPALFGDSGLGGRSLWGGGAEIRAQVGGPDNFGRSRYFGRYRPCLRRVIPNRDADFVILVKYFGPLSEIPVVEPWLVLLQKPLTTGLKKKL